MSASAAENWESPSAGEVTVPTVGAVGTLRFDGLVGAVMDYLYTLPALAEKLVRFTNLLGATNQVGFNIGTFV